MDFWYKKIEEEREEIEKRLKLIEENKKEIETKLKKIFDKLNKEGKLK